jgi:hypothetical protein
MSPAALKSMCSKIALERSRPAQWAVAKELRDLVRAKVEAGEPTTAVEAWLHQQLRDALAAQG